MDQGQTNIAQSRAHQDTEIGPGHTCSSLPPSRETGTPAPNIAKSTCLLSFSYLAVALACLIQWRTSGTWSRVDVFSGGYLVLRAIGTVHSILSARRAFRSRELRREWWGTTANPGGTKWVVLFMLGDLTVFLDYGHWHTLPSLERPMLQALGLGLYGCTMVWQVWTDTCLGKYFANHEAVPTPITTGPFRHIRHPRYAGVIVAKIAFALTFASTLGWVLAAIWLVYLMRNVAAEEAYLRRIFGDRYQIYARTTARLLPRIY
jgi:protein-S-isoprenylcysteine O-methyltransferase Ste14